MKDPIEVSPLSREVMLQPLSDRLQISLRFFDHPLPTLPSTFLAVGLPLDGRKYGLTVFRTNNIVRVRPCLFAGGFDVRVSSFNDRTTSHTPFGPSLSASLARWVFTTFISSSLMLALPLSLASHPH
jgi:hypothetical protein